MKNKLSIAIITLNEEKNIERCLRSVQWADEIIIVDSGSSDRTVELCKNFKCQIIQTEWKGFGLTKKMAVDAATNDWVLSIDADEEMTSDLRERILGILEDPQAVGYKIKRNSFFMDKMIKHCGWDKDYPLRLFHRGYGNFNEKIVHEGIRVNGAVEKIEEPLLHYTYPTIASHIDRMNRYSGLGAEQVLKNKKNATIPGAVSRGIIKFIKMYLLQKGFLDGRTGFILSFNSAFGVYLKYIKIWEKNQ